MPPLRLRISIALLAVAAALFFVSRQTPVTLSDKPADSKSSTLDVVSPPSNAVRTVTLQPGQQQPAPRRGQSAAEMAAIRENAVAKAAVFTDWLTAWRRADGVTQSSLVAAGRAAAEARRDAVKNLIPVDPQLALELAVPVGLRSELPPELEKLLERRIDARGNLEATIGCYGPVTQMNRTALINGEAFETHVYGRRADQYTKLGLPLHGIAIDQVFALHEAPFRLLDDGEKAARSLAIESIAIAIGATVRVLTSPSELEHVTRDLVAAESKEGPHVANSGSAEGSSSVPSTAATTPWILGAKRILWVKVDFADDPGAVATDAEITATNTHVSEFYAANSQGKTTMSFTIVPTVLRLPRDKSVYNASSTTVSQLQADAAVLAKAYDAANGGDGTYDPDKYDRWIVVFKRVPAYAFGGQAQVTGPQVRMNGTISQGTTAHELGHTQGLSHAHYWLPAGTSGVGAGAHVEYGDVFDNMGSSGSSVNNHFNAAQKSKLGYLDAETINTVSQSGTFRIARHDHANAAAVRSLKVAPPDLDYDYWLEYRRFGPTAFNNAQLDRLRHGVILHWGAGRTPRFTTGGGSYLVDATAGSAGGANDAPLRIGEAFVDPDAGVTIKPLAVGGTAPNEYIEVQVGFGAIDGNRNPVLQADVPAGTLAPRSNIIFTADASDPDGDPVYFRWDFGDRAITPTLNNITRRFTKGGTHTLRVSAHDGKGGIAAKLLTLNIVDPLLSWTSRTSGVTATLNDVVFAGGRFVAAGTGLIVTSPDGVNWTRSASPGAATHTWTSIAHNGARYVAVGLRGTGTDRSGAAYSDDGQTWTVATIPSGTLQISDVAFGGGRFVGVGDGGRIFTSVDGTSWESATSPFTTFLRAIHYAGEMFVATGDSGRIATSNDGLVWTNRSVATTNSLASLTRHAGAWFVSSATAEIFTSVDGSTWSRIASTGRINTTIKLISTGGLLFSSNTNGSVGFTEDPRSWVGHQIDATPATSFNSVAEGNGTIVVVGSRGSIHTATAAPVTSPAIAAPTLRIEADALKVAVGKKNVLAASGAGFVKLELYANGTKVSELTGPSGALEWTPRTIGNYSLVVRGVDASGASVVSAAVPAIAGLPRWTWSNPTPIGADLQSAVRVGDKWWVVGRAGAFVTVDDSGTVSPVDFPTTQHLTSIAYANGRFIVTGPFFDSGSKEEIGSVWTSTDGYSWTPLLTTVFDNFNVNFAAHGGGRWLIGTTGGLLLTSADGLAWTRQVSGVTTGIRHAVYGNNRWVAVGAAGRILTSPDGVTWTSRTSGVTTDFWSIAFDNGTFVAVGNTGTVVTSSDGLVWSRASSGVTASLFSVTASNNTFTAVGNSGTVISSSNGANWTAVALGGRFADLYSVAGSGSEGLIVGRGGEIYQTATGHSGWRRITQGSAESRQAVIYAGGRFVSVGAITDPNTRTAVSPTAVSTNGVTWTRGPLNPALAAMNAIGYGQLKYVAVGARALGVDGVANTADDTAAFTSLDGLVWIPRVTGVGVAQLHAVAASPGLFVAAGNAGALLSSTDGTTWTPRTSGVTSILRAATYGRDRYVVVGDAGVILTSTDGATWAPAPSGVTTALNVAGFWENFGFIVGGAGGTLLTSPDGLNWQQVETGISDPIGALTNTPVGLVAAGGQSGTLILSLDGASWSIASLPADHTIRGLATGPAAVVAVGDFGNTLAFEFVDSSQAPVIAVQPAAETVAPGGSVTFAVNVRNAVGAVYQWFRDGAVIVGANAPTYRIPAATASHIGAYTVLVATPSGRVTSMPAALTFGAVTDPGRLVNLSIRTELAAGDTFIFGVVVGGAGTSGSKPLVVRAVGPSLTAFGLTSVLADPKLEFYTGAAKVGENDNWGGGDTLRHAIAEVGAFPFSATSSLDAAMSLPSLASGANSVKISGTGSGTVLAELYDATPATSFTGSTPRLVNVSVLKHIGSGVTAGFVVGGSTPRRVLIRAIGPTLGAAPFGVGGVVVDPQLTLFSGPNQIAANDNWGGTTALTTAFSELAAFPLPADSRDAALLTELQPGSYTVQVTGAGGSTGVALIEVYEAP